MKKPSEGAEKKEKPQQAERKNVLVSDLKISPKVMELIPVDLAKKYRLMPVFLDGENLTLAMADPTDQWARDDIQFYTGLRIVALKASESDIREAIEKYYKIF